MSEIKHIVFDIGRVLIHYDPEIPFKRIIPDEAKRAWFFENVCTGAWNIEQDRGRSWEEAEALLIADHPDWQSEIRAFRSHWHEMVSHPYSDNVSIFEHLVASKMDVTLLTNFADDTFSAAQEIFPFLTLGRGVTVSGRVKLIKPDPAIYALHARTFDLSPAHTLFIDDSAANIEAARAEGWHGIHLPPGADLRAALDQFGV